MSKTTSSKKELFKGFFLPWLLFLAALPIALVYVAIWNQKNGDPWNNRLDACFPATVEITLAASLAAIAILFWKGKKLRAYGFIAGLVGTPVLLVVLFWAWLTLFKINLFPH
ncbi:MAG TPA: hypothetical protein VH083_19545 [Myxococcales bacterium]|jgi:ABC-type sulfate transport system permease component|nr:hypothetical protein [Myxococcales bacterium]